MPRKKCPPDLNVPYVPTNTNSMNYWDFEWVNYARDFGSISDSASNIKQI